MDWSAGFPRFLATLNKCRVDEVIPPDSDSPLKLSLFIVSIAGLGMVSAYFDELPALLSLSNLLKMKDRKFET